MALLIPRAFGTCIVAIGLAACGDGLIDQTYLGDPLLSFEGQIVSFSDIRPQGNSFEVGVFWSRDGRTDGPLGAMVEQPSAGVEVSFPASFRVNVFEPPPVDVRVADTAVGVLLVYEDRDGNGRLTRDGEASELLGGAERHALVWAAHDIPASASPTRAALRAGYQLLSLPLWCDGSDGGDGCGVAMGAACDADTDCGAPGICLRQLFDEPVPGGICVLPEAQSACRVPTDVLVEFDGAEAYFLPICADDRDCRQGGGWACDPEVQVCLPRGPDNPGIPPASATCAASVGGPCGQDADCGAEAVCLLREAGATWVRGTCAVPTGAGCAPSEAATIDLSDFSEDQPTHWLARCRADADCRASDGYVCDGFYGVCLPDLPIDLVLADNFEVAPLCDTGE